MNPEVKIKWINALRSDEYEQGESRLFDKYTKTYCGLGVLCDVYRKELGVGEFRDLQFWTPDGEYSNNLLTNSDVQTWAELDGNSIIDVYTLNDVHRKSFKEIANWIDENL